MEINEKLLHSLIIELEHFPDFHLTSGGIVRDLHRYGSYVEEGLEIRPEDMEISLYYAGLAVLCRDMHRSISLVPGKDTTLFEEILFSVIAEDRKIHHTAAFPYSDPDFPFKDILSQFPEGLAVSAANGSPDIKPLRDPNLVHEWTIKPGKRLYEKFAVKFKKIICGKNGPYEQMGKVDEATLMTTLATTIIQAGFSAATFWYPLVAFITMIVIKRGLKKYCES